jgi:aryl-phospho-beta-D-glucosidase BglC (GH1 family)
MLTRILVLLAAVSALLAQTAPPEKRMHRWWTDRPAGLRPYTTDAKKMPLISVKGNKFVDPQGNPVLFRGLAISDPDKLDMEGHWNREHFVKVKEMGARVVRIPVHPVAWRERTPAEYLKLLDQAVDWCTELDMYIDLDWHSIGNLPRGQFESPMYDTSEQETFGFWRTMARHYAGHNTVAFFELFNEPSTYYDKLGPVSWEEWKKIDEELIAMIRAYGAQAIPLVAGFDWAYDLTPLRLSPVAAEGIGYSVHPYANKRPQPWEGRWEEDFGFAAAKYPVVATEFGGFGPPRQAGSDVAPQAPYGPTIIKYLEGKGISWIVWCFDPEWGPTLIGDWNYTLNPSGEFVKQAMHGGVQ